MTKVNEPARPPGFPQNSFEPQMSLSFRFSRCTIFRQGKPYSRRGRFTDTWIKVNETWQCVASQSTLIQD